MVSGPAFWLLLLGVIVVLAVVYYLFRERGSEPEDTEPEDTWPSTTMIVCRCAEPLPTVRPSGRIVCTRCGGMVVPPETAH